jgi:hypothetical protein
MDTANTLAAWTAVHNRPHNPIVSRLPSSKEQTHVSTINIVAGAANIARNPVPRKRRADVCERYPKATEIRSAE